MAPACKGTCCTSLVTQDPPETCSKVENDREATLQIVHSCAVGAPLNKNLKSL